MKGTFLPYKLFENATYPMKPWFYSPFKGEKEGLPRVKTYWNFIQSDVFRWWWKGLLEFSKDGGRSY
jgi:hypothetical protein